MAHSSYHKVDIYSFLRCITLALLLSFASGIIMWQCHYRPCSIAAWEGYPGGWLFVLQYS